MLKCCFVNFYVAKLRYSLFQMWLINNKRKTLARQYASSVFFFLLKVSTRQTKKEKTMVTEFILLINSNKICKQKCQILLKFIHHQLTHLCIAEFHLQGNLQMEIGQ